MNTEIHLICPDDVQAQITILASIGELRKLEEAIETSNCSWKYPVCDLLRDIKAAIRQTEQTFKPEEK
jgi:hypothetical protein